MQRREEMCPKSPGQEGTGARIGTSFHQLPNHFSYPNTCLFLFFLPGAPCLTVSGNRQKINNNIDNANCSNDSSSLFVEHSFVFSSARHAYIKSFTCLFH